MLIKPEFSDRTGTASTGNDFVIAIFAGGKSIRMGQDKSSLRIDGQTMLDRTIETARCITERILVVGKNTSSQHSDVTYLTDDPSGVGPIGGLRSALYFARVDVVAIACDMPNVSCAAIQWLVSAARHRLSPCGLVVQNENQIEPLFSVYGTACLPVLEKQLQDNNYGLIRFIQAGKFNKAQIPDQFKSALLNVNTPQEFHAYNHEAL